MKLFQYVQFPYLVLETTLTRSLSTSQLTL